MGVKITTSQDMNYELITEGVYDCIVTKIVEKEQFNRFNNAQEIGFNLEFTIQSGEFQNKKAFRFVTPYLTPKSILSKFCRAVMGREFTPEELAMIKGVEELQRFVGLQPVKIIVKNVLSAKTGKKYYNITDFVNAGSEVPVGGVDGVNIAVEEVTVVEEVGSADTIEATVEDFDKFINEEKKEETAKEEEVEKSDLPF